MIPVLVITMRKHLLLKVLALCILMGGCRSVPEQRTFGPVEIREKIVAPEAIEDYSSFLGTLEASSRVNLKANESGRITGVLVKSGDSVRKGQVIVEIDQTSNAEQLGAAQAQAKARKAALEAAESEKLIALARKSTALAELRLAEKDLARSESLAAEGAIPRRDLDLARKEKIAAQALLDEEQSEVVRSEAALREAKALYEEAVARTRVEEENLERTLVSAPIGGVIGDLSVKTGDLVDPNTVITSIIQNEVLVARINVPARRLSDLKPGLKVEIISSSSGETIKTGSISFISPTINTESQSVLVKAVFPEPDSLQDGQAVTLHLHWGESEALLIPLEATVRLGGQHFVFVVDEGTSTVTKRPVELGGVVDGRALVLSGLKPGDRIATSNVMRLRNGAQIQRQTEGGEG